MQGLLNEASAAFRAGRLDDAEAMLEDALARSPRIPGAHDVLARIALSRGRPGDAIAHSQKALAIAGENPIFHNTLVKAVAEAGALDSALAEYGRLVAAHPESFGAAYGHAMLLLEVGRKDDAVAGFRRALAIRPDALPAKRGIMKACEAGYRFEEAARAASELVAAGVRDPGIFISLGRSLHELRNYPGAAEAFGKALELDQENPAALSGLSASLGAGGRPDEGRETARRLFAISPVYRNLSPAEAEADILVVSALKDGYFPKPKAGNAVFAPGNAISQVPPRRLNFHYIYADCPDLVSAALKSGPFDAVYNNAANAESVAEYGLADIVNTLCGALALPVANPPAAVALTSRQRNAERIPAGFDVIFPKTRRFGADMGSLAATRAAIEAEFGFPVLLRDVMSHHDTDIVLAHEPAGLMEGILKFAAANRDFYAIEYCTEEYGPGIFRKLRASVIDGKFYPVHIGFSPNWNVHRAPMDIDEIAFMKARPDLMESEKSYLRDPEGYIGAENVARLEGIAGQAGMDYLGIDYCLRRDGKIIIFEANAAMNAVHANRTGDFPYLAERAGEIIGAFENMLLRKAGRR